MFDIIKYISSITTFAFDKGCFENIALERGVSEVKDFKDLTEEQKDLLKADLYYLALTSPDVMASISHKHGSFSESIGAQKIGNKDVLYDAMNKIYRKYNDPKADLIRNPDNMITFVNEDELELL